MVTAILIPIILLYFYFLTRKEMRFFHDQWTKLDDVHEEAIVAGEIIHISEEKQRFYYHRYVHHLQITVKTTSGTVVVKKLTPIKAGYQIPNIKKGDIVRIFGNWENREFHVARIEKDTK